MKSFFKRIKNSNPFNIIIAIAGIMLLVSISVLFGYSISTGGLVVANSKQSTECYYLIEIDSFEKFADASNFATNLQAKGGAGFIKYDENFKVFSSAYQNYEDAKNVLDKLSEYKNAKIYTFKMASFNNDNGLEDKINKVIKNNIISIKYSIENLSKILIELDKNQIDENKFKEKIILIKEEIELQIEKFLDVFYKSSTMYKYKSYMYEFLNEIEDILKTDLNDHEFSSICHYKHISLVCILDKILQTV